MHAYNYVALDISISSTGVFILTKEGNEHYFNYKNNDKLTKWQRTCSFINYRDYEIIGLENFSDNELGKLIKYDEITDKMLSDILSICKPEETIIATENYSYGSAAGHIIHLVSIGTLVRNKILKYSFVDFKLIPPSSLKQKTCELVYGEQFNSKGKKIPSKNKNGIAGGRFKKTEMFESLLHYNVDSKLKDMLLIHKEELLKMKSVPAPISDIVDAMFLVYILLSDKI